jgi:hypothetical protein
MRQHISEQPRRPGAGAARRGPPALPNAPAMLLQLQRGAGNAAVGRFVRRTAAGPAATRPLQRQAVAATAGGASPGPAAAAPSGFEALCEDVKAKIEALNAAEDALKAATGAAAKKAAKKARNRALADHRAAVLALATFTRENMPPRALLDGYLDRTDVTPEAKVATLGQLAAAVARMEFLLGTMYQRGTKAKWETATNRGAFPDVYEKAIGGGAQPWCTNFVGYAYTRLGFRANAEGTTSEFMSGYRLREWSAKGKGVSGEQITPAAQTVAGAVGTGSALIDRAEWKRLRKDLKAAKTQADRLAVTEAFFAGGAHPLPQPGDIVVKPRGDAAANNEFSGGKSHTMLVESFDASAYKIHTIEGNVGDKVGGRTIDLTDPVDVSKIIFLTRMGTQFFGASPTATGGTGATGTSIAGPAAAADATFGGGVLGGLARAAVTAALTGVYSRDALTGGMHAVIAKLAEIDAAQGWIKSADPDASVTEWTGATGAGNES